MNSGTVGIWLFIIAQMLKKLKEDCLPQRARRNLKDTIIARANNFNFGQSGLKVLLDSPTNLGSACYVTATNTALARICADSDLSEVKDSKSFVDFLVRTYDYNRIRLRSDPPNIWLRLHDTFPR